MNVLGFVAGGFSFPYGKNHIAWRDLDSVFVCPAWEESQLTRAGYPREVWLLERGQSWDEARCLLQLDDEAMMAAAWRFLDADGTPFDMIEASDSFYSKTYHHVAANLAAADAGLRTRRGHLRPSPSVRRHP